MYDCIAGELKRLNGEVGAAPPVPTPAPGVLPVVVVVPVPVVAELLLVAFAERSQGLGNGSRFSVLLGVVVVVFEVAELAANGFPPNCSWAAFIIGSCSSVYIRSNAL